MYPLWVLSPIRNFFRLDFIRKLAAQYARKACSIGYDRQVVSHAIGGAGFVQVLRRGKAVIAGQDTAIIQKLQRYSGFSDIGDA